MAERLHFDVHPSVVFQLGEDLISDDIQALIELIKNSYDADATYAHLDINTQGKVASVLPDTYFKETQGYIQISDDGLGMDLDAIKGGWLIVSNSMKRKEKAGDGLPPGRRTPLGDKGLGRLGSQRLAKNLEVVTVAKGSREEYQVGFSWEKFAQQETLRDVPIEGPKTRPTKRRHGTVVLMSGLLDPERWRGSEAKTEIEDRFAELISPFEHIEAFDLVVTIDGVRLDIARIARKIRKEADVTFRLDFDRERLVMEGRVKLRQLEPTGETRQHAFEKHCRRDGGHQLLNFLKAKSEGQAFQVKPSPSSAWFAYFEGQVELDNLDKVVLLPDGSVASPGPFRGEVDAFDLGVQRDRSAFGGVQELRKHIRRLRGVRVYRDGFGVRVGEDFLRLARAWTGGKSWYGLRPTNTIGFIAISARENPDLVETTDREGFKRTSHFRNFELLLDRFVDFTHEILEFSRRETIAFCDSFVKERAEVTPDMRPEQLSQRIGEHLERAANLKEKVSTLRRTIAASAWDLRRASETASRSLLLDTSEASETRVALQGVRDAIATTELALEEVDLLIDQAPRIRDTHIVLQAQIERFNDQLAQAYETMGLGLTSEALVHEISVIAGGLGERLSEIRRHLKNSLSEDHKLQAFVRHVDAAVSALRKQLGHLDPALRYVRERRELIDLETFLSEIEQYHEGRWREGDISIEIEQLSGDSFEIQVNRGKLTQIFDNLILNSEYWLREDIRRGRMKKGEIKIELQRPFVWLSDNGRGIDPSVESTLFEPFVTTRRSGRGLGLFIVRELLGSEGCGIGLYRERNASGRLFAFELDLGSLVHGDER